MIHQLTTTNPSFKTIESTDANNLHTARKKKLEKMSGRYSILASAVHSSLPRTVLRLHRAAVSASTPEILPSALGKISHSRPPIQQQTHQFPRSCHSTNSASSPPSRAPIPYRDARVRRVDKFEAWSHTFRCYGQNRARNRVVRQFLSLRDMDSSVSLTARVVSSRSGKQPEEMHEPSTSSTGSDEYLVGGRYCVLLTGHASDYTQNLYGGYGKMFVELLSDPDDKWDIYAVVDGQFPPEEELEKYDGFVLTGSRHDAHGSDEWITKLCAILQSLHEKKQNILGICFGHQVLSRALGGKTGRTDAGWEIGLRDIQTTTALASKAYAVGVPPVLRVMESHQDQVQQIPPGGELLGFSEKTAIEVFAVGDHVLGIQGHPEFTEDVVKDLIDTRLSLGMLTEEEAKDARATLRAGQADREALVQLCKGFLKRRRP
ncbi:unnamed protein product [Calypogeia fissa]